MTYKTILVHCDASAKLLPRLEVAVDLAQRFGAHLVGVHVQAPIHIPAFSAGAMPPFDVYDAYEAAAKAEHDTATATFEEATRAVTCGANGAWPRVSTKRRWSFRVVMLTCSS